jgi:hypothetical protein
MHMRFVVPVVALIAGCAGGTDPKAEYIEEADAICQDALVRLRDLTPEEVQAPDPEAFRRLVDVRGQAVARVRHLKPPPGDDEAERVIGEIAKGQELFERGAALAGTSEMSVPYVIEGGAQAKKAQKLAASYGFRECSRL